MSKFLYTVVRPFTFRGVQFKTGDPFDATAMQCDNHRTHTLMNQRYIEPGYDGEAQPKSVKPVAKHEKKHNEPEKPEEKQDELDNEEPENTDDTQDEPDDEESDGNETEESTPRRRSPRRRS